MTIKIDKFLWNHQDNHDKYWGWVIFDNTYYNFWGKRLVPKITFKRFSPLADMVPPILSRRLREKLSKGYVDYTDKPDKIDRFFPNFHKECELQLTIAKLGDNFHYEDI